MLCPAIKVHAFDIKVITRFRQNLSSASLLTNRELVILERLVKRLTYREIAEDLTISPETVKSHATSIYRKLKVSGRLQVIDTAQKMGFFSTKNN